MRFHRDAQEIPTEPAARKALVRWVMDHRLWMYPVPHREPPPGREMERFGPPDKKGFSEFLSDGPDWIDTEALLGGSNECIELDFVYVNPVTERIEDDDSLNTVGRVWVESGGWHDQTEDENGWVPDGGWTPYNRYCHAHDYRLDCGAWDIERAYLELAVRVKFFYGDSHEYRTVEKCDDPFREDRKKCLAAEDGYCSKCGFVVEE